MRQMLMTGWATCCLSQSITAPDPACTSCMCIWTLWYVWSGHGSSLTRGVRLLPISDCQWITVTIICSQLQIISGRNIWSLLPWAPSVASDIWKTQVVPTILLSSDPCVWAENVCFQPGDYDSVALHGSLTSTPTFQLIALKTGVLLCIFYSTYVLKKTSSNTPQVKSMKDIILRK